MPSFYNCDIATTSRMTRCRIQTKNLETILMLADVYERTGDLKNAAGWYNKSLPLIQQPDMKKAVEIRVEELTK